MKEESIVGAENIMVKGFVLTQTWEPSWRAFDFLTTYFQSQILYWVFVLHKPTGWRLKRHSRSPLQPHTSTQQLCLIDNNATIMQQYWRKSLAIWEGSTREAKSTECINLYLDSYCIYRNVNIAKRFCMHRNISFNTHDAIGGHFTT